MKSNPVNIFFICCEPAVFPVPDSSALLPHHIKNGLNTRFSPLTAAICSGKKTAEPKVNSA
ncbi:hypothetical protein, partial [Pantoea sp. CTOTU49201]|uniref:hypothetical protein n=1 Tax=Pantoea sp. CTOTU49201 TaxID=2953855 RepID=UPI00289EF170